jgi:hypothetical protein
MKLYNLYQEIILEEKSFLTENVKNEILKAMDGKYNIWFKYKDDNNTVTDRYVQIYDLGVSKAGNEMISAYQLGGNIKPTKKDNKAYGWKQFILDKIIDGSIKPVSVKYQQPVSDLPSYGAGPKYNKTGNKNMVGTITKVDFNKK